MILTFHMQNWYHGNYPCDKFSPFKQLLLLLHQVSQQQQLQEKCFRKTFVSGVKRKVFKLFH